MKYLRRYFYAGRHDAAVQQRIKSDAHKAILELRRYSLRYQR